MSTYAGACITLERIYFFARARESKWGIGRVMDKTGPGGISGNASDSGLRSALSDHMPSPTAMRLDFDLGTRTRTVRAYYVFTHLQTLEPSL
jgi:hypothetical protein